MTKVISFDFWNTLVKNQKQYRVERSKYLAQFSDLPVEDIEKVFEAHKANFDEIVESTGVGIQAEEAYAIIFKDIVRDYDSFDQDRAMSELNMIFLENRPLIFDETVKSTLEELSKTFKLVLISNTVLIKGVTLRRVMEELGIIDYFEVTLFSDEVGVSKPNPQIYQLMLNTLGVNKSEILHIGDNKITDVEGPIEFGFQARLVNKDGITFTDVKNDILNTHTNNKLQTTE